MPETFTEEDGWRKRGYQSFAGGLNASLDTSALEDDEVAVATNVVIFKKRLELERGYTTFGSTILGTPRTKVSFQLGNGTVKDILVTNVTVYVWNSVALEWQYISNATSTTLTANASAGNTTITVASISGFTAGEKIAIELDSGAQHRTTINGAPAGNTITLTDAFTGSGVVATSGNDAFEAVALTGTDSLPVDTVPYPGADVLVITNSVNTPLKYNGTTCIPITGLPGSSFAARFCETFGDYLLFGYTTEDGVDKPYRIRRNDTGDITDWTTGNAGYDDLLETPDFLTGLYQLGPYMIAYKDNTNVRGQLLNQTNRIFDWKVAVRNAGAVSNKAIVEIPDSPAGPGGHMVMGPYGIYRYRGDFGTEHVDANIFDKVFAQSGEMVASEKMTAFGILIEEYAEAWFFYSITADNWPTRVVRVNIDTGAWVSRDFGIQLSGAGVHIDTAARTWDSFSDTWNDHAEVWNSRSLQTDNPVILLLGATALRVYKYDFVQTADNGTAITFTIETKDFIFNEALERLDRFVASIKGTVTALSYSTDRGGSWTSIGTFSGGVNFTRSLLFLQTVVSQVRFRLTGTGASFGVEYFYFYSREETAT